MEPVTAENPMVKYLKKHLVDSEEYRIFNSKSYILTETKVYTNNANDKIIFLINKELPNNKEEYFLNELLNTTNNQINVVPLIDKHAFLKPLNERHKIVYENEFDKLVQLTPTEIAITQYNRKISHGTNEVDAFYFVNDKFKRIEGYKFKEHPIQKGLGYYPELITNYQNIIGENLRVNYKKIRTLKPNSTQKLNLHNNQLVICNDSKSI